MAVRHSVARDGQVSNKPKQKYPVAAIQLPPPIAAASASSHIAPNTKGSAFGAQRPRRAAYAPYLGRSSLSHRPHWVPTSPSWPIFHGSSKDEK